MTPIKIIPELLEQRIGNLLGRSCMLLSEENEKLGRQLLLILEGDETNSGTEKIRKLLRAELAAHEIPKKILYTPEFPMNPSMKPDRRKISELFIK